MGDPIQELNLQKWGKYTERVGGKQVAVTLPNGQIIPVDMSPVFPVIIGDAMPPNFFNSTDTRSIKIDRSAVEMIKHISLIISITVNSSSVVLAPVPNWFNFIDLESRVSDTLQRWFPDSLFLALLSEIRPAQFPCLLDEMNMDSRDNSFLGQNKELPPGTYTFTLPLGSAIFDRLQPFFKEAKHDLFIKMETATGGIIVSGNGTVTCNRINLLVEGERMTETAHHYERIANNNLAQSAIFLQPFNAYNENRVLEDGTNTIQLINLRGQVPFLQVIVRPQNATNSDNGRWHFVNIGDDQGANMDVVDATNNSLLLNPLPTKFMRNELWTHNWPHALSKHKPFYIIPHTQDATSCFQGVNKGYLTYTGNYSVVLNCKAAVNEVQTITCVNAANDGGYYKFRFRGVESARLNHNASTADMAAAVAAIPTIKRNNITVSFSKTMSANVVATFTTPETAGLEGDLLEVVPLGLTNDGVPDAPVTTRTVVGKAGITPGSYHVTVLAYIIHRATFVGGQLYTKRMGVI